jgi:ankyrin repeat protein
MCVCYLFLLIGVFCAVSSQVLASLEPQIERIARWLQRAGVPANLADVGGNTPLHFAAYGGSVALIRVLVEMGADVNAVNREKRTPLHFGKYYHPCWIL